MFWKVGIDLPMASYLAQIFGSAPFIPLCSAPPHPQAIIHHPCHKRCFRHITPLLYLPPSHVGAIFNAREVKDAEESRIKEVKEF